MDFEPNFQKEKDENDHREFEKKEHNHTIRSFRELADAISVHSSKMFSVPFLRTQETTIRMILIVIVGCAFTFGIPFNLGWLGLLVASIFTQNALGAALMNSIGVLLGGVSAVFVVVIFFIAIPVRDHWLLPAFFMIITTGIVWWTNFNVVGKKIFLLFLILLVDKDYQIMTLNPNATMLDTNGTLFYTATNFAYSALLAAGLILLGAILPWIRYSRKEIENEMEFNYSNNKMNERYSSPMRHQHLETEANENHENNDNEDNEDNENEEDDHVRINMGDFDRINYSEHNLDDMLLATEEQLLKIEDRYCKNSYFLLIYHYFSSFEAFRRLGTETQWETFASLAYYTNLYRHVNNIFSATKNLQYWISKTKRDNRVSYRQFLGQNYEQFLLLTNRCFIVVEELISTQSQNVLIGLNNEELKKGKANKSIKKLMNFLLKLENELDPSNNNRKTFFEIASDLYFGYGLIEIYKSIIILRKFNTERLLNDKFRFSWSLSFFKLIIKTRVIGWIESYYYGIVPWTPETPKILDYLSSKGGKKRLMLLFGILFTQTIGAIILFNPVTRAVSLHVVWFPVMSLLNYGTSTVGSIQKAKARILGTTFGVSLGFIYYLFDFENVVLQSFFLCLIVAFVNIVSIENEDFCRITILTYMLVTFGTQFLFSFGETIEGYSLHRFFWVVMGILINLLFYFLFWFKSTRQDWSNTFKDTVSTMQKLLNKSFERILSKKNIVLNKYVLHHDSDGGENKDSDNNSNNNSNTDSATNVNLTAQNTVATIETINSVNINSVNSSEEENNKKNNDNNVKVNFFPYGMKSFIDSEYNSSKQWLKKKKKKKNKKEVSIVVQDPPNIDAKNLDKKESETELQESNQNEKTIKLDCYQLSSKEILSSILSSDSSFVDPLVFQLDAKLKAFKLACIQIYDEPRLWEVSHDDIFHINNLILQLQKISNEIIWFSKFSTISALDSDSYGGKCQKLFKKSNASLDSSLGAMKHIFTSKDNIPHVLFTDYRYYINGKYDQKIFQEMIYSQKWSNDLITLILINKTINFRVHEMWDLLFNLTVYSKLQMLDNSSKLPV